MVQWLRICQPVLGTGVHSWSGKSPTCHRATWPVHSTTELQHQSLHSATGGQRPAAREGPACCLTGESSEDPEQPHRSEQTYKNCTKCFPSRKIFTHWPVSLGIKGLFRLSILFSIWCFTHFKTHVHVNTGETLPQTTKFLSLPKLCAISVQHFSFLVVNPTNPDMVLHSQHCLDLDSPTVFASQNLSWDHFPSP